VSKFFIGKLSVLLSAPLGGDSSFSGFLSGFNLNYFNDSHFLFSLLNGNIIPIQPFAGSYSLYCSNSLKKHLARQNCKK
jgi:hypothetical protein